MNRLKSHILLIKQVTESEDNMKKFLLIGGIVLVVVCVISLLYAALNFHGYRHIYDGSAELYRRLHQRANIYFAVGIVLAAMGATCFVLKNVF